MLVLLTAPLSPLTSNRHIYLYSPFSGPSQPPYPNLLAPRGVSIFPASSLYPQKKKKQMKKLFYITCQLSHSCLSLLKPQHLVGSPCFFPLPPLCSADSLQLCYFFCPPLSSKASLAFPSLGSAKLHTKIRDNLQHVYTKPNQFNQTHGSDRLDPQLLYIKQTLLNGMKLCSSVPVKSGSQ